MTTPENHSQEELLKGLIDKISAYVEQYHGGSVEFVSFDGNRLEVRLGGACCGAARPDGLEPLKGWVAGTVHQFFPDVEVVAAE